MSHSSPPPYLPPVHLLPIPNKAYGSVDVKHCVYLQMSQFVVVYLNPYRRPDCKEGRILSTEDFKHLARRVSFDIQVELIIFAWVSKKDTTPPLPTPPKKTTSGD